jgi:hypothetical protein
MSAEHDAFVSRVTSLIEAERLSFADPSTVADALLSAGESIWFPSDDAKLGDRLHTLYSRRPDLRTTVDPSVPTRAADPNREQFIAWMGPLAARFESMLPDKKLALFNQFQREKASLNAPTQIDSLTREFQAKHGPDWRQKLSTTDKMRLADLEGSRGVTGKMSHYERAHNELMALKAKADHGLGPTWEAARLRRIQQLERAGVT